MRLRVNNVPVACGLGQAQRPPLPAASPVWQCFAADGQRVIDTRLSYVLAANGWDVTDGVPEGNGFRVRDLPPAAAAPNLLYFSDLGSDGVRRFSFSWQFEEPAADERLRFDAIERGASALATALVVPAANPDARPKGLVLAAFDSMHQRLWQQRIDQELPSGDTGGVGSLVARDRNGQHVYVAFHPRLENLARPVRVCRFGALDGVAGPCVDTPFNARASALVAAADGRMLLWAQPLQDGLFTGIGLYPLSDSGAGSPLFWSADHLAQSRDNTHSFFDTAWTVLEPRARLNPAALGEGTSTAVVAVSLSVLFANGFE